MRANLRVNDIVLAVDGHPLLLPSNQARRYAESNAHAQTPPPEHSLTHHPPTHPHTQPLTHLLT